ncbi:MSMEG_0565 family glycosyltransferase [Blastococcus sp. TF02A-26]|uniref:MSMEG_0565 family glycosyltransferase n=1 Tax=Blastococcus sp. TF02A-26 TaxID=2250577 RepID=UPI000DE9DE08|nr:MSMEG_0565 family glycosyltransferase [Blastococcus sp. TF02A-26]RBY90800.1 MSMEG_0565 family glycosyltransferase [Blastococcus sp. TF02A-26]
MDIALLLGPEPPRGVRAHTVGLANALARLGERVTVWELSRGRAGGTGLPVDPAVRLLSVPFPDVPGEDAGARLRRAVAELGMAVAAAGERYDVVHAQDCTGADAVPGCVRTVHTLDGCAAAEPAGCSERAFTRPTALFCGSAAVAAQVRARWGRDAVVLPGGVDTTRFAAAAAPENAAGRNRWRARLGRYVLAVGGVEPRKGTLDLVEAMATVRLARPDLALVLAGEASPDADRYRAVVDARAQELEVYPLVLGHVPDEEFAPLVAGAQALAVPSTEERFGSAVLEGLAAGVPVVARDLPAVRASAGGVVSLATGPAGFAAGLLAAADADRRRLADGRAVALRHGWDAAARAHLRCYRAVADAPVPHAVGA